MWSSSAVATTVLLAPPIWRWPVSRYWCSISAPSPGAPRLRKSSAPAFVIRSNPKIIRDLDLAVHGLRIVDRPVSNFLPLGDGSFLKVGGSHTKREVAKFSARDADRLDDYQRRLAAVADILRASVLETPPNVVEGSPFSAIAELFKAGRIAKRIRALGRKAVISRPLNRTRAPG